MELRLSTFGNDKQKECCRAWLDDSVSEIIYGGSKGSGKSYIGSSLIFGDALIYPGTHLFIARKKLNDLRKFTIPTIHEVLTNFKLDSSYYKYNGQDNYFELYNQSKVFLLEAKYLPSDPHFYRYGSMQMTRGMIEEGGEFVKDAKSNLHASIGRWKNDEYNLKGKLLTTCNPSKNYLYKDIYKPHKNGTLASHIRFIQALPSDNKMLAAGYLENLNRILSKNEKERLLYGNWEYDDNPNALCDYEAILSVFTNDHIYIVPEGKIEPLDDKFLTADIARFGSDKAVILVWSGWTVIEAITFDKSKTTDIQNLITALRVKHNIPKNRCIADEDGVGGGVVDNCGIKGFVNNSSPIEEQVSDPLKKEKPNFSNLQSQCIYYLAKKINNHEVFIKAELSDRQREEITEELETIESYQSDGDSKLRILPKEAVKDKIGRSPDWRDAIMMRKWFDLKPVKKAASFTFNN